MRAGKLTAVKVAAIVREAKPGYTGDGGGLYLQVSKYGTPSWCFRYRLGGRLREAGLGSLDTWSLAEARERARKFRQMRADGIDPIEARREQRRAEKIEAARAITFRACAEAYIEAHRAEWRSPKSLTAWESTLAADAYPVFGDLPVQAVDTAIVTKALQPIWSKKPETASRLRGRIEAILDWAKTAGYREGENPARWKGHLENLLAKRSKVRAVKHHPALAYDQLGTYMAELRQQEGVAARALEFGILTVARTGEVIGARWSEIDRAERVWTIPAARMKSGREHRVPLSDAALAIVNAMWEIRSGDFIFPGLKAGQPLSNMSMLMLLRRLGRDDLTVHGFRSTFSDWCAERTNFSAEVREMALAHAVGDKVEEAYRRGDLFNKRRQLADAWAKFCAAPSARSEDNVQLIGARRRA